MTAVHADSPGDHPSLGGGPIKSGLGTPDFFYFAGAADTPSWLKTRPQSANRSAVVSTRLATPDQEDVDAGNGEEDDSKSKHLESPGLPVDESRSFSITSALACFIADAASKLARHDITDALRTIVQSYAVGRSPTRLSGLPHHG